MILHWGLDGGQWGCYALKAFRRGPVPEPTPSAELVLKAFADQFMKNPLGRYVEHGIASSLRAAVNEDHEPEVPCWYLGDSYWVYQQGMEAMRNHVISTADAIDFAGQFNSGQL